MGIVNDSNLLYISLVGESDTQSERSHTVTTPAAAGSTQSSSRAATTTVVRSWTRSRDRGVMRVDTAKNGELHVKLKRLVPSVHQWTEQAVKGRGDKHNARTVAAARKHDRSRPTTATTRGACSRTVAERVQTSRVHNTRPHEPESGDRR